MGGAYLAAVGSSLDVSGTHLVISDSAVQVGRAVADLVLDHGEARLLQDAITSRTCSTQTPHCCYTPPSSSSLAYIFTGNRLMLTVRTCVWTFSLVVVFLFRARNYFFPLYVNKKQQI